MKNFLFDARLVSALRVNAETETMARGILQNILDCAAVVFPSDDEYPEPITGEVSLDTNTGDDALKLVEMDGEAPINAHGNPVLSPVPKATPSPRFELRDTSRSPARVIDTKTDECLGMIYLTDQTTRKRTPLTTRRVQWIVDALNAAANSYPNE